MKRSVEHRPLLRGKSTPLQERWYYYKPKHNLWFAIHRRRI